MAGETEHVMGGETVSRGGDPAPYTARGVVNGIKAGLEYAGKAPALEGVTIAIQGLGALGYNIAKIALNEGANVIGAEIKPERQAEVAAELPGVKMMSLDGKILFVECDVLCPCALGGTVTAENLGKLKCKVLCAGAEQRAQPALRERQGPQRTRRDLLPGLCRQRRRAHSARWHVVRLRSGPELDRQLANIQNAVLTILNDAKSMPSAHDSALAYAGKRLEAGKPLNHFATA